MAFTVNNVFELNEISIYCKTDMDGRLIDWLNDWFYSSYRSAGDISPI